MIKSDTLTNTSAIGSKSALVFGAALLIAGSSTATANLLVSDDFSVGAGAGEYELAALVGQGPSTLGWSGNWGISAGGGNADVVSGGLTYAGFGTSNGRISGIGQHVSRNLATTYDTGTIYLSFLTEMIESGGFSAPLQLFLFDEDFADDGGANRPLYIQATGGNYVLNVEGSGSENIGAHTGNTDLLVLRIDFGVGAGGDEVWVWRNPDITGAEPALGTANANIANATLDFGRIGMAMYGGDYSVDQIRITETWAAIPEPSTYALFAGLGILGLAIVRRRFRK